MNSEQLTRISFDDNRTVLSDGSSPDVLLNIAAINIATRLFRHDPPAPREVEQAIEWTEDALTTTGMKQNVRGNLLIDDPRLLKKLGLYAEGERMTRNQLEARFQRLASISLGHPRTLDDPSPEPMAFAMLVILRECMHHLGYDGLVLNRR